MNTWIGQVIHSHLMYRSCLLTHTLTPHTPPRTKQHTHTRTHTHRLLSLRTPFLVMLPSMLFWSPPSATRTQRRRWCLAQSRRGACEWGRRGGEYVSGGGEEGSMWVGKARKEAWELVRWDGDGGEESLWVGDFGERGEMWAAGEVVYFICCSQHRIRVCLVLPLWRDTEIKLDGDGWVWPHQNTKCFKLVTAGTNECNWLAQCHPDATFATLHAGCMCTA